MIKRRLIARHNHSLAVAMKAVYQDSIDIGTPGKGGAIKVYGDTGDPDDYQRRIDNAVALLKYTRSQLVD